MHQHKNICELPIQQVCPPATTGVRSPAYLEEGRQSPQAAATGKEEPGPAQAELKKPTF